MKEPRWTRCLPALGRCAVPQQAPALHSAHCGAGGLDSVPKPATPVPAAQPAPAPWKSAVPAASLLHIQSQQGAAATVLGHSQASASASPAAPAASPAPKGTPGGPQQSRAPGGEPEQRYSLSAVSAAAVWLCAALHVCWSMWTHSCCYICGCCCGCCCSSSQQRCTQSLLCVSMTIVSSPFACTFSTGGRTAPTVIGAMQRTHVFTRSKSPGGAGCMVCSMGLAELALEHLIQSVPTPHQHPHIKTPEALPTLASPCQGS